jgi:hypothetical protein
MYKYWITLLLFALALVFYNQWRLNQNLHSLRHEQDSTAEIPPPPPSSESAIADLQSRLDLTSLDLATAHSQISNLNAKVTRLEEALSQLQSSNQLLTNPQPTPSTLAKRNWGPEQAAGPPDTPGAGDLPSAWASLNPDDGPEWLQLTYSNMVNVAQIIIRETHQPGAVTKITSVLSNGQEYTLWEGIETPGTAPFNSVFDIPGSAYANSIKIYLDTSRVPGWNEIDAVELIGRDGSRQWAATASASSTYAERTAITATQ